MAENWKRERKNQDQLSSDEWGSEGASRGERIVLGNEHSFECENAFRPTNESVLVASDVRDEY